MEWDLKMMKEIGREGVLIIELIEILRDERGVGLQGMEKKSFKASFRVMYFACDVFSCTCFFCFLLKQMENKDLYCIECFSWRDCAVFNR